MKNTFFTLLALLVFFFSYAQKTGEKEALTYDVSYNGKTHTVQVGDTVQLGYGSYPNGSFMYIHRGSPPNDFAMGHENARKTGTVTKVKYIKSKSQYQLYIDGTFGWYIVDLPQAVEKEEVIGFNQTMFK